MKSLLYHLIRTQAFPLPSKIFWQLITMGVGGEKEKPIPLPFTKDANLWMGYQWPPVAGNKKCSSPCNVSSSLHPKLTMHELVTSAFIPIHTGLPMAHGMGKTSWIRRHTWVSFQSLPATLLRAISAYILHTSVSSTIKWWCWTRIA